MVTLGLTLITTLVGGVLALDRGDLWYRHIIRRQAKRSKLAEQTDVPGVVFLEIDGLAYDVLRRAMRDGNAPGLARWVHDRGYRIAPWETDWSSQTGACQAGLLHGNDHDMPAFRWWEKDTRQGDRHQPPEGRGRDRAPPVQRPRAALRRRREPREHPLRRRAALDADDEHGARPRPPGPARAGLLRLLRQPVRRRAHLLRVIGEIFIERFSAVQQVRRDVRPRIKRDWEYALVRAFATVIQLDLQVAAVTADVLGGPAGDLHDVPGLRRGRAPLRARAAGHAGGAAAGRPRDRADRRRRRARAAPVRARRALRPRPEPGRDLPPALRRGPRGRRQAPLRRRGAAPRTRTPTRASPPSTRAWPRSPRATRAMGHAVRTAAGKRLERAGGRRRSRTCR